MPLERSGSRSVTLQNNFAELISKIRNRTEQIDKVQPRLARKRFPSPPLNPETPLLEEPKEIEELVTYGGFEAKICSSSEEEDADEVQKRREQLKHKARFRKLRRQKSTDLSLKRQRSDPTSGLPPLKRATSLIGDIGRASSVSVVLGRTMPTLGREGSFLRRTTTEAENQKKHVKKVKNAKKTAGGARRPRGRVHLKKCVFERGIVMGENSTAATTNSLTGPISEQEHGSLDFGELFRSIRKQKVRKLEATTTDFTGLGAALKV